MSEPYPTTEADDARVASWEDMYRRERATVERLQTTVAQLRKREAMVEHLLDQSQAATLVADTLIERRDAERAYALEDCSPPHWSRPPELLHELRQRLSLARIKNDQALGEYRVLKARGL